MWHLDLRPILNKNKRLEKQKVNEDYKQNTKIKINKRIWYLKRRIKELEDKNEFENCKEMLDVDLTRDEIIRRKTKRKQQINYYKRKLGKSMEEYFEFD